MIKNFNNGTFLPKNPTKYCGKYPIIFRSGYERKFMGFCDTNQNIIKWSSESIVIEYPNLIKKRVARYFPDFYMKVIESNGVMVEYLIEIKPAKETTKPLNSKGKRASSLLYERLTYVQNVCKWKAAEEYCKKRNWIFKLITEKELGI